MAFKFILGHHIKSILNDVEEKQKKDISDYAKGHLNESRLLNAPLSFNRKSWASARGEQQQNKCNKLNKPSNFVHKINIKERISPRIDALFDFSLGTSGVIPPLRNKTVKTPEVRYRLFTHLDPEKVKENDIHPETPLSLYSQLDDGVLIEELPLQEVRMPIPDIPRKAVADDKESDLPSIKGDSMTTSDASFHTKPSVLNSQDLYLQSTLGMFSKGITRKDQYKKMMDFNAEILRKNDMCELNIMSGEKVALHHAIKLDKELEDLNLSGMGPNFHRLQVFSNVLDDIVEDSPIFNHILSAIKTEYDNYIAKLLDGQTSQQHLLRDQVNQMASRGTSRPGEMSAAAQRLKVLEDKAKYLLEMNERLKVDMRTEQHNLNKTPEVPVRKVQELQAKRTPPGGYSKKEQPVELSLELENMKALILEKLDELNTQHVQLREDYVPITVCTHLEQCIKETEVEVQKLLKQNEYFERSIAEMEADLKEAIIEADTSEKDARRIWRKVNSRRGMPGSQHSKDSDDDCDDETKWNWYIS